MHSTLRVKGDASKIALEKGQGGALVKPPLENHENV